MSKSQELLVIYNLFLGKISSEFPSTFPSIPVYVPQMVSQATPPQPDSQPILIQIESNGTLAHNLSLYYGISVPKTVSLSEKRLSEFSKDYATIRRKAAEAKLNISGPVRIDRLSKQYIKEGYCVELKSILESEIEGTQIRFIGFESQKIPIFERIVFTVFWDFLEREPNGLSFLKEVFCTCDRLKFTKKEFLQGYIALFYINNPGLLTLGSQERKKVILKELINDLNTIQLYEAWWNFFRAVLLNCLEALDELKLLEKAFELPENSSLSVKQCMIEFGKILFEKHWNPSNKIHEISLKTLLRLLTHLFGNSIQIALKHKKSAGASVEIYDKEWGKKSEAKESVKAGHRTKVCVYQTSEEGSIVMQVYGKSDFGRVFVNPVFNEKEKARDNLAESIIVNHWNPKA